MSATRPEWQDWPEEPFVYASDHSVRDASGKPMSFILDPAVVRRAVACVNALASVRNPAAVREVVEAARLVTHIQGAPSAQGMDAVKRSIAAALAALDQEQVKGDGQ